MSKLSSTDKPVTKAELQEFYQQIFPYLGGNKAVDSSPIGTVISYMGTTPPAGYLACDGSKLSATAFPSLFDVLKTLPSATRSTWGDADWVTEFNVPNLQGEFLRGMGTNSHTNQGGGANVGIHQDGTQVPNTSYSYTGKTSITKLATTSSTAYVTNYDTLNGTVEGQITSSVGTSATSTGTNAYFTTRPTNTSVLYCIKYTYVFQEVNYSEQEIVVGVDENGDGIYEKVINAQVRDITIAANKGDTINLEENFSYTVKSLSGSYISTTNGNVEQMPYIYSNNSTGATNFIVRLIYSNNLNKIVANVVNLTNTEKTFNFDLRIIVQYTKTS